MKNFLYVSSVLAILSMTACEKEDTPTPFSVNIQDAEMATFEVCVSESDTKALTTEGESDINSVQIYVFNAAEGFIEAYYQGTASSERISCTTGEKEIVALVNAKEMGDIAYKDELFAKISDLSENSTSAFVMLGSVVETITVNNDNVFINVTRLVARISIGKITKEFTLPLYQNAETVINRIFLENVAGDVPLRNVGNESGSYTPTVWYNMSEFNSDLPDLLSDEVNVVLDKEYSVPHYFYCYPNPNSEASATRLVVEATVRGIDLYYPITIPKVKANHSYHISELTITRLGYLSPDKLVDVDPVRFIVEVSDWESGLTDYVAEI